MHGVRARTAGTAVLHDALLRRTPIRAGALLRRVVDIVARIARGTRIVLERMQQAEPVPDFMHRRLALLVAVQSSVRHRGGEDVAAVLDVRVGGVGHGRAVTVRQLVGRGAARRRVGDGLRQGAVAEELRGLGARRGDAGGEVGLEVDVEGCVGALAERGLHGCIRGVGCPFVVDGVSIGLDVEGYVGGGVG